MSYRYHGARPINGSQCIKNELLIPPVQVRCDLIQQEQPRTADKSSGQTEELLLATRQIFSALTERRLEHRWAL